MAARPAVPLPHPWHRDRCRRPTHLPRHCGPARRVYATGHCPRPVQLRCHHREFLYAVSSATPFDLALGAVVTGPTAYISAIETDRTRTGNMAMISNGMPCYFIVLGNGAIRDRACWSNVLAKDEGPEARPNDDLIGLRRARYH